MKHNALKQLLVKKVGIADCCLNLPYLELGLLTRIYNYGYLIDIKDERISTTNYIILGRNLRIKFLHKNEIVIDGEINCIYIGDSENENKAKSQ